MMEEKLGSSKGAAEVESQYAFAKENGYASCWHMNDGPPSEAVWKDFGGNHAGIAIRTDLHTMQQQLADLLQEDGPCYIGQILYVDHGSVTVPEGQTLETDYIVKDGFRHEGEVRVFVNAFSRAAFDVLRLLDSMWGTPLVTEVPGDATTGRLTSLKGHIPAKPGQTISWMV